MAEEKTCLHDSIRLLHFISGSWSRSTLLDLRGQEIQLEKNGPADIQALNHEGRVNCPADWMIPDVTQHVKETVT